MRSPALLLCLAAVLSACGGLASAPSGDLEDGWTDLFDGATLEGWHGYASTSRPAGWSVEDGILTFTPVEGASDIVAPGTYDDFELEVEWSIGECGNSGVLYRGEESVDSAPIWRTALEMQLLDDACHPDAAYPSHRAGALYDLYTPTEVAVRPAGAWNTSRIVADGPTIEHWLNGRRIIEAEQGSPEWNARVAASKFRDGSDFPGYGTRRSGIIGLQNHGDPVRFRAVRIRTL